MFVAVVSAAALTPPENINETTTARSQEFQKRQSARTVSVARSWLPELGGGLRGLFPPPGGSLWLNAGGDVVEAGEPQIVVEVIAQFLLHH